MSTYVSDNPLVATALVLLDEHSPKGAAAIRRSLDEDLHPYVVVTIDWAKLELTMLSSTERTRLDMARSVLDGTPVSLASINSFGDKTWDLMMRAFEVGRGRR